MNRFYLSAQNWSQTSHGVPINLDESESHHALHVLRLKPGDKIVVFNGEGLEATAEITSATTKHRVALNILQQHRTSPLPCSITLAQAIPKGKNMDLIIQKATELGASEIVPILSERVVTKLNEESDAKSKQSKWQTIAIEAAKQCGQNWLPKIQAPQTLKTFFQNRNKQDRELMLIASLQTDAKHLRYWLKEYQQICDQNNVKQHRALMLVGPEGDFTPAELSLAKSAGCNPITLGPIILRTETAAIYCLSILSYEMLTGREATPS